MLQRQGTTLKTLTMGSMRGFDNRLSAEQKQAIRTAAMTANPECSIEGTDFEDRNAIKMPIFGANFWKESQGM